MMFQQKYFCVGCFKVIGSTTVGRAKSSSTNPKILFTGITCRVARMDRKQFSNNPALDKANVAEHHPLKPIPSCIGQEIEFFHLES
jgi:hypothetical protein